METSGCGGCDWQHVDYAAQLDAKRAILRDALERIARVRVPERFDFQASPREYGYRTRARICVAPGAIGFRRRASHEVCDVAHCPVLAPELEAKLAALRDTSGEVRKEREVEIAVGSGAAVVAETGSDATGCNRTRRSRRALARVRRCVRAGQRLAVRPRSPRRSRTPPERAAASSNCTRVRACSPSRCRAPSSAAFAVESSRGAADDLAFNLERAGRTNVEVVAAKVEAWLARASGDPPDVVVLDPPRTGLGVEVARRLAGLGAPRIVYLSCDPATLARDVAEFGNAAYEATRVEGFDLFPQTAHVEALVLLERR